MNRPAGQDGVFVVDSTLCQRRLLPSGQWHLVFDGGYCGVEDTAVEEGRVILMEEYLEKKLWKSHDGDDLVEETAGKLKGQTWNFSARLRRFQETTVKFNAGLLKTEISWVSYQVNWPRAAKSRFLWSLSDVYRILKLTSFSNKPSKWVHDNQTSWSRVIENHGGAGNHLFRGRQAIGRGAPPVDVIEQFLPSPAITTYGLITLLCAFCSLPSQSGGGLKNPSARMCARVVFEGLLVASCPWRFRRLFLRLDPK